jgi:hypothetical protein
VRGIAGPDAASQAAPNLYPRFLFHAQLYYYACYYLLVSASREMDVLFWTMVVSMNVYYVVTNTGVADDVVRYAFSRRCRQVGAGGGAGRRRLTTARADGRARIALGRTRQRRRRPTGARVPHQAGGPGLAGWVRPACPLVGETDARRSRRHGAVGGPLAADGLCAARGQGRAERGGGAAARAEPHRGPGHGQGGALQRRGPGLECVRSAS